MRAFERWVVSAVVLVSAVVIAIGIWRADGWWYFGAWFFAFPASLRSGYVWARFFDGEEERP